MMVHHLSDFSWFYGYNLVTNRVSKHQGSKKVYNFKKVKRNKRIADKSRRINRGK